MATLVLQLYLDRWSMAAAACGSEDSRESSAIHLSPVANSNDENTKAVIFDAGDDAVITDTVFPEFPEFRPFKSLTENPRIFQRLSASGKSSGSR